MDSDALRERMAVTRATVAVVGQGYVGLSLAAAAAAAGFSVTGVDVNAARVADLAAGRNTVPGVPERAFRAGVDSGKLRFTTDTDVLAGADVVVLCVPTPLQDQAPDLSFVRAAAQTAAERLRPGQLVILESTTYPGTTDELVRPILESGSGLACGEDFLLAYSPERIDPGNETFGMHNTPKVVGGITPEAGEVAVAFYGRFADKIVPVSSCRAAELTKLLENTFRHVNIALVNEMAMFCHNMDIDIWEVVAAASTKPFGFMPFLPGPGVGGHCIPLDPTYLAWQVRRQSGQQFRILEQAQDINAQMPAYVVTRIGDALNERGRAVNGARILILGVAYKPDVGDVRESPALEVIRHLRRRGGQVSIHDPHVDSVTVDGETFTSAALDDELLAATDCVAVLTPHHKLDLDRVARHAPMVFDARNAYGQDKRENVIPL
jgi:UDP-N-acetyl-D-glucosamine dehydrogenase